MKNTVKTVLTAALLCAAPFAFAAQEESASQAVAKETQTQIVRAQRQINAADRLGLSSVEAEWERCEIKEFRSRAPGQWGKKLRIPWNCRLVSTQCGAVVSGKNIFTPASCFYAPKAKNESIALKRAHLTASGGEKTSILAAFGGKVKDFAVFTLN